MRITFRKGPQAIGLASIADPYPDTKIKVNGKEVGAIRPPSTFVRGNKGGWKVMIAIAEQDPDNPNCPWQWVVVARRLDSEPEGREKAAAWLATNTRPLYTFTD